MRDEIDLKGIFSAIEQIDFLSEERKKKIKDKNQNTKEEIISKPSAPKDEDKLPINTEEIIKQAEKQLNLIKKNKLVFQSKFCILFFSAPLAQLDRASVF